MTPEVKRRGSALSVIFVIFALISAGIAPNMSLLSGAVIFLLLELRAAWRRIEELARELTALAASAPEHWQGLER